MVDSKQTLIEPQPGQALVVRTAVTDSYPTEPLSFFLCEVLDVGGDEVEGGEAAFTPTGEHLVGFCLNGALPTPGAKYLAREVDGRWVLS